MFSLFACVGALYSAPYVWRVVSWPFTVESRIYREIDKKMDSVCTLDSGWWVYDEKSESFKQKEDKITCGGKSFKVIEND